MSRHHFLSPCRRAFTLIETLVVVTIVSVLIAILIPSLQQAREMANQLTCSSKLRSIAQGALTYTIDNNLLVPISSGTHCEYYWEAYSTASSPTPLVTMAQDYCGVTWAASGNSRPAPLVCPSSPKTGGPDTRYGWYANNFCVQPYNNEANSASRPFPLFRTTHMDNLTNWRGNPMVIAMDHINSYQINILYPGTAYSQYYNNHVSSTGTAAGGNFVVADGSAKWFAWNNGVNWDPYGGSSLFTSRPFGVTLNTCIPGSNYMGTGDGVASSGNSVTGYLDINGTNYASTHTAYNKYIRY